MAHFVITETGKVLIQGEDNNQWGFALFDDDQKWAGGSGAASSWDCVKDNDPRITAEDHERLDWVLEQLREEEEGEEGGDRY